MSRAAAEALWGPAVVARALADPEAAEVDGELVRLVAERSRGATSDGAFARWALTLPWARFVELVRLVTGATRQRLLEPEN